MKIKNIIEGWYRRLFKPLNEHEKRRLQICEMCEKRERIGTAYYCSICYCICSAKVRAKNEVCPLNKW